MRSWNLFVGFLGEKFWTLYRKNGFMRTFLRGRIGFFTSIQKGGPSNAPSRLVGTDEYGNQYYEDVETNYYINRRWVEFSEAHRFMSHQAYKLPPPWHGWLTYTYDETPSPKWRPPRTYQMRLDHPYVSNFHMAPGSFGNQYRNENFEYVKQKTYLEWNPPNTSNKVDYMKYDRVLPYDITQEN